MTKIVVFAGTHSEKSDEYVTSQLAKGKFQAYFIEAPSGIIESRGLSPLIETSYNFAKKNNIPVHLVDDYDLLTQHSFADHEASRIAYSIMNFRLRKLCYNNFEDFSSFKISNEKELEEAVNKLSDVYEKIFIYVRKRSDAIAKNTNIEIKKNGYSLSSLQVGRAHKDVANPLRKNHEVELVSFNEDGYRHASIRSDGELRNLCETEDIKLDRNSKNDILEHRKRDIETLMKFMEQKISSDDMRRDISGIYLD